MRTRLVDIGNSQGICLPKAIIEQAKLTEQLDLEVSGESIIIRSHRKSREAWAEAAADCDKSSEDRLDDWDATAGDFASEDIAGMES
ncbi:MAG: AbrB/MazE/SpoVT family DNA-binding domain-containing protein [Planctomycetes bacterium]|nr:AbrB/MazE/SpoVT family DNA-binding domain-containing protein [Planctomycetota bacterium]